MGQVYCITNTVNGKCYVGQTTSSFEKRYGYNWPKNHHNELVLRAVAKYGLSAFRIEILAESSDLSELNILEQSFAEARQAYKPAGYNLVTCGDNKVFSAESREKMAKAKRGKRQSPEMIEKRRKAALGRKNSEAMKAKISATLTGRPLSDERKDKIRVAHSRLSFKCSNGKTYHSYMEASKDTGLTRKSVKKAFARPVSGFTFEFV